MKRVKEVILLIGLFVIVIILILFYFVSKYNYNKIIGKTVELSNFVSDLDYGVYSYRNGVLFDENGGVVNSSIYFDADGKIGKDKYGHISINLKYGEKYICKSALGDITYSKKCNGYDIDVEMARNNYQISFSFNKEVDGYKISSNDDFAGEFLKLNIGDENFVLNLNHAGTYFIWFKDKYGNVSDGIKYNAECLNVVKEKYSSDVLYCTGSVVNIGDESFIVIRDEGGFVDLMSYNALDEKMAHCSLSNDGNCYYVSDDDKFEYSWGNSSINKYLNDVYFSNLSDEIRGMIVERDICNNYSGVGGCDNGDGCGGFKKEVIEENNWVCRDYVKSKIRLISYDEYVYLIENSKNKITFNDYFHMINSSNDSMKNLSVLYNGDVFTKEKSINKLSVRTVFTIKK